MTDLNQPTTPGTPLPPQAYGGRGPGPLGQVRGTGISFLLMVVTFGIYGLVYYYQTHEEMKQHSGQGLGGTVALLLSLFVGPVMVFLHPAEVGALRERAGLEKRVSGVTGLWNLLPFVGTIVWFVKTNGALNDYWTSQGAPA